MRDTIAYIPNNAVSVSDPNLSPRNAHYWRGEVERCSNVAIHPDCRLKSEIALAYASKGINILEWPKMPEAKKVILDTGAVKTGMWQGQDVVIIGGGPSLRGFDFDKLKTFPCKTIAINRAYEYFDADMLFSMDKQFYDWAYQGDWGAENKAKYEAFIGLRVATAARNLIDKRVINLGRGTQLLSKTIQGGLYTGGNSGFAAIHLACILGAKRVFLLGYDCKPTETRRTQNFHTGYKTSQGDDVYNRFRMAFDEFAPQLKKMAQIINCNPDSGIRCFEFGELPNEAPLLETGIDLPPIVSYVTPAYHKVYEKHLSGGVKAFDLPLTLVEMESVGNWKRNACIKPSVIAQEQRKNPTRGIVWLDADSSIERVPVLFAELERQGVDFAAHSLPSGEMLSSVLYFGATETAEALLAAWGDRCKAKPEQYGTADQKHLQNLCEEMKINVYPLPAEYCKIFDHPKQAHVTNPVIVQHQASREMKRKKQ